jgi:hypothetical protein
VSWGCGVFCLLLFGLLYDYFDNLGGWIIRKNIYVCTDCFFDVLPVVVASSGSFAAQCLLAVQVSCGCHFTNCSVGLDVAH